MKLSHVTDSERIAVTISGEIDGSSCTCLEHFWDRFVSEPGARVRIDMAAVDDIDSEGVAQMVTLVRRNLADGCTVTLDCPPQMLSHTFYKTGMLTIPGLTLIPRPREEPYAG